MGVRSPIPSVPWDCGEAKLWPLTLQHTTELLQSWGNGPVEAIDVGDDGPVCRLSAQWLWVFGSTLVMGRGMEVMVLETVMTDG